jgi:hypothetical protein
MLYDSKLYRNAQSPISHTVMGFEGVNPHDYRFKIRTELEGLYGEKGMGHGVFRDGKIVSLKKAERDDEQSSFEAIDDEGRKIVARKVVLATGIKDVLPAISGMFLLHTMISSLYSTLL